MRNVLFYLGLVAITALTIPAQAEPAKPTIFPPITSIEVGVFCDPDGAERLAAPDTELGWITRAPKEIDMGPSRQVLPADLGLAFGVTVTSEQPFATILVRVTRPGRKKPDEWTAALRAGVKEYSYFAFEYAFEQVPGLYVIEGFADAAPLYRAEFEVRPTGSMPKNCRRMP
jgi:hypothetical protein